VAGRRALNVVLDTCALLALAAGDLSREAVSEIRRAEQASVSSVTAWEIAIKVAGGKLQLDGSPARWFTDLLEHYELREVHLDAELACAAAALPKIHRDPFDRAIVALARATDSIVITSDERIRRYPGVTVRW
jgi:PIN domain nuclease of toxin-antitoxin system